MGQFLLLLRQTPVSSTGERVPVTYLQKGSMFLRFFHSQVLHVFPPNPIPLRRSGSEPALPTFLASDNGKGQEVKEERGSKPSFGSSTPDLYKLLDVSWSGNLALQDDGVEAKREASGSTITFSCTSLDVLWFLEDSNCKGIRGPQVMPRLPRASVQLEVWMKLAYSPAKEHMML